MGVITGFYIFYRLVAKQYKTKKTNAIVCLTAAKKLFKHFFKQLQKILNKIKPNKIWYSKRVYRVITDKIN